jgi:hypothetical protein
MWDDPIARTVFIVGLVVIFVIAMITNSSAVFVIGALLLTVWVVVWTLRRVRSQEQLLCIRCGEPTRWRGRGGEPLCYWCWAKRV